MTPRPIEFDAGAFGHYARRRFVSHARTLAARPVPLWRRVLAMLTG